MFSDITFKYAFVLWFLLLIPALVFWYIKRYNKNNADVTFSSLKMFEGLKPDLRERLQHLPFILKMLALALLLVALARPQSFSSGEDVYTEGIDIAMVLDISGSMLAEDFQPNRLGAAKAVIDDFIKGRTTDKIGLVVFAGESFTQCPLTIDYSVLRNLLGDIESGMLRDGTAIGNSIATGVSRLKDSEAKSKVIILLTDGDNNAGEIAPEQAAQIAKEFGIRIYTIGVGKHGKAPYPMNNVFGKKNYVEIDVNINEELLQNIAETTGGKYFRAVNNRKLAEIYGEIDKMEKTRVEITSYRTSSEHFYNWALAAFILLLLEFILSRTYLKRLP